MSKIERTLAVLQHVVTVPHSPTHAELGRALRIPRSTLSDLLADLRRLGCVREVDHRYVPGPWLVSFVHAAMAHHADLLAGIQPTLEHIAARTRETAAFVVELPATADAPRRVVSVGQAQSPDPIRYVAEIGVPYPMETTAAGQALRVFADPPPDDAEAAAIRERGYALRHGERGQTAISAPVLAPAGAVVGVVSVTGPSGRMTDAAERVWPVLREALADLRLER